MRRYWRSMHRQSRGVAGDPARSFRRYRRFRDGITPQMCNRVTDHRDMGTFSKPAYAQPHSKVGPFFGLSKFWSTL